MTKMEKRSPSGIGKTHSNNYADYASRIIADRYRKGSSTRVAINCKITAVTKPYLNRRAGEFAIGYATELRVAEHRQKREKRPQGGGESRDR